MNQSPYFREASSPDRRRARGGGSLGDNISAAFDRFAAGEALDYEVVKQTPDAFEANLSDVATPNSSMSWAYPSWDF